MDGRYIFLLVIAIVLLTKPSNARVIPSISSLVDANNDIDLSDEDLANLYSTQENSSLEENDEDVELVEFSTSPSDAPESPKEPGAGSPDSAPAPKPAHKPKHHGHQHHKHKHHGHQGHHQQQQSPPPEATTTPPPSPTPEGATTTPPSLSPPPESVVAPPTPTPGAASPPKAAPPPKADEMWM